MMKGLKRFDLGAAMKEFMQERLRIQKETRHQVCEEIREKLRESSILTQDRYIAETILDEIEGEN